GLAELFPLYRAHLAERGAVDFDEQIYAAVEALLHDGAFRRRAQARHRHLLVDEFQDLTPAHVLLLRLLAAPTLDVFAVGDDDQVIYGHAGADPHFLVAFDRFFPAASNYALEVNYRCPVAVVDAAVHLLSYNRRRVAKDIRPGPAAEVFGGALRTRLDRPEAGAAAVVEEVARWLDEPGTNPGDVAVLTRVNSLLLAPHVALAEADVALASVLSPDVLSRTGLRAALAYLRLATRPLDLAPDDLAEIMRRPSRGLPNWITKWFRPGLSIEGVRAIADRLDDAKVAGKIEGLAADLDLVEAAARSGTTRDVLCVVKDGIGLGEAMELLDRSKGGEGSSQLDDLEGLLQVADLHPDPATFEDWLRGVFRREHAPGGVTLSTIHRVKGQEWDRVAVFGATAGVLPHRLAVDVEEERRVLHVAITRARRRVVVLGDASRPSSLLAELDGTAPRGVVPTPTPRSVPPSRPTAGRDQLTEQVQEAVYDAVAAWRKRTAAQSGKPAYVVLSNASVAAIAVKRPTTLRALVTVPGIGPAKLELYGEELLEVLSGFTGADEGVS
ncbi:MAG: ATP-dependent DNA helicase UvrD2, partial [Acidimicrobiales bacterium]